MALDLKTLIAEVPDYPKPGISFKDLTPLLSSPAGLRAVTDLFADRYRGAGIDAIVAAEARGFLFGGALAHALGTGLIPVRKPKKLPRATIHATYALEYGTDELHMHRDAIKPGQKILIIDDVLATGGTAKAMADLVTQLGGSIVSLAFVIELGFLKGREKLSPHAAFSLVAY
jgi:adenine phosphoribosyltransferase